MKSLKYKIIKSREQYDAYCNALEELLFQNEETKDIEVLEEIELLTLLIEKWDKEHNSFMELEPIQLLKSLMAEHHLRAKDLVDIMGISKGMVSNILNYRKGLSKESIRKLSIHFKLSQEAFNKPYKLITEVNKHYKNANLMNTKKDLVVA
ncbi:MAG: transcriptional regulator [Bacteroidetes bacterium]|nr:transcriptional regulator [Bacteroidota bacterium]MBL7104837.1 transcriptional regulator [Bacteroidales bacterium]